MYISRFGSYGTSEWIKNISDIDIGIILNSFEEFDFELEDKLTNIFKQVYNYDNVNLTIVVEMNIDDKLTRNILCGKTLYSKIDEKSLKRRALDIEKGVARQREYYEFRKLQKLKEEVIELWQ